MRTKRYTTQWRGPFPCSNGFPFIRSNYARPQFNSYHSRVARGNPGLMRATCRSLAHAVCVRSTARIHQRTVRGPSGFWVRCCARLASRFREFAAPIRGRAAAERRSNRDSDQWKRHFVSSICLPGPRAFRLCPLAKFTSVIRACIPLDSRSRVRE